MIVKNESKIILRLLNSVVSLIDSYCICDTGSTDNTIELIENFFNEHKKSGKIVKEDFRDFSYNRNYALNACFGMSDYVLLLDADMELKIGNFDKSKLNDECDGFLIFQGSEHYLYKNTRIIKNNGKNKYVCRTHEYINLDKNITRVIDTNELFINDIGDGGSKTTKFERDEKLLLMDIEENIILDRNTFYLANTYVSMELYEKAITYYEKRIKIGGWIEETWYCYYKMGQCYKYLDKMNMAIATWLEGYDVHPKRLENIYEIIRYYRTKCDYKKCGYFYDMIKNTINDDRSDCLFLEKAVYTYKLYYEYEIFSYYNGNRNINDEVVKILSNNDDDCKLTLHNLKFYNFKLTQKYKINFNDSRTININKKNDKIYSSSSCLLKIKNGYLMNIRYVNYLIQPDGSYVYDKQIITINKYVELNNDFKIINENIIKFDYVDKLYIGVDDIRIFEFNNEIYFIGTGYTKNNTVGVVNGVYNKNKLIVNELEQKFMDTECEKNWVYVNYKNNLNIVYCWFPLTMCKIENNELKIVETKKMSKFFENIRGSTSGYNYNNEIWFVVHIVSYEKPRHYYHIIVVFDENMNLLRHSALFKFENINIEYVLSIVVERNEVIINYSTMDKTTNIGIYDKQYIDSILIYN